MTALLCPCDPAAPPGIASAASEGSLTCGAPCGPASVYAVPQGDGAAPVVRPGAWVVCERGHRWRPADEARRAGGKRGKVEPLKAPFPWFGGKSRAASLIWPRFGDPANYVEPFAGSIAVLLARPTPPRIETINDADCYLANYWRAVAREPDTVAVAADWPVNEADLHARHRWLVAQVEFRERMRSDPEYYDAKVAGWWVWGLCAWIGSGWCSAWQRGDGGAPIQLPHLGDAGRGVHRKLPHLGDAGMGQLPDLGAADGAAWGRGIHGKAYRPSEQTHVLSVSGQGLHGPASRISILETFVALSARLRGVRVACGDFERVLSDSVTWRHGTSAILIDPPYADGEEVYSSENGASVFARAARWAEEHWTHPDLRIALCYYEGTWTPPAGGEVVSWKAKGGYGGQRKDGKNENADRERIAFSPACLRPEVKPTQGELFGGAP